MSLVKSSNGRSTPAKRSTFFNDPFFSDVMDTRWGLWNKLFGSTLEEMDLTPAMNIHEKDNAVEIELAVPGLKRDDFDITLENGILTISAEKEEEREEEKKGYYRREFSYNTFSRSIPVPESVDEEKDIDAKYFDGILKLTLPKRKNQVQKSQKKIKVS